jgi:hypothetical protein
VSGSLHHILEHAGLGTVNTALRSLRIQQNDVQLEELLAVAEKRIGLSDWGHEDYFAKLGLTLDCLAGGNALSPIGRMSSHIIHRWHAYNRLRVVDTLKRDPTIAERKIEKPIFIVGWFRTATTSLHNLLSLDPRHRAPDGWELCYPAVEVDDSKRDFRRRFNRTRAKFNLAHVLGPEQKYAHELRAENHEECFFLMANSAVSIQQIMGLTGYQYARELLKEDMTQVYLDLKQQYQMLDAQRPGEQWVMKCPYHLWYLGDLLNAFPDARIIHTHRTAVKAVPSVCSLSSIMSKPLVADFNPERHGAFFKEFCREGIDRAMKVRLNLPAEQLFDVRLEDLDRDPEGTVRTIYEHFDLEWDEETMPGRIRDLIATESQRSKKFSGMHKYTAEQFGLTREELRSDFADYEEMFIAD